MSDFEEHMNILRTILERSEVPEPCWRRELEQRVRRRAVALATQLAEQGHDRSEAARRLGVGERTLRQWEYDLREQAPPAPLGRPPADSGAEQQQAAFDWLNQIGPGIGVPALRQQFPEMARAELTELLRCYRDLWQTQHTQTRHVLRWLRPGTVWAMDFAKAPAPIDGVLLPEMFAVLAV